MKKVISVLLVFVLMLLSTVSVYATSPHEANTADETQEILCYNYDVATKTVKEVTFNIGEELGEKGAVSSSRTTASYCVARTTFEERNIEQSDTRAYGAINNPEDYNSYRNVVFLDIILADGSHMAGSGFMIGPAAVATSAHLVYNEQYGGSYYPADILVAPACTGDEFPYGGAYATSYIINADYLQNSVAKEDWAVILLDTNIGDYTGWLGLKTKIGSYNGTSVTAAGYPSGVHRVMHSATGTITTSQTYVLKSTNINTSNGMSGGPVFIYDSSMGYLAIAIVSGAEGLNQSTKTFTRITNAVYEIFLEYRNMRV